MKCIFSLYFLLQSVCCIAQGKYIDRVAVNDSEGESYALYVPETYNKDVLSPILFVFTPDGNGKRGVAPFKKVADERGMIVLSSNNSRNGPYDTNLGYAQRLFDQVFSQYAIDPNQLFLAGFSGGSRLASTIASLSGNITGVIACGAGFSGVIEPISQRNKGFIWLGIVGDQDFNYSEMLKTSSLLKKLQYNYSLQLFSGNHRWPPSEEIEAAFRYLDLQLHKESKVTLLPEHIENHFKEDLSRLSHFKETNDLLKAAAEYKRIISGYNLVRSIDSIIIEKTEFLKSSGYKKQKKKEDKVLLAEEILKNKLWSKFEKDYTKPNHIKWNSWTKEINNLKKESDELIVNQMHKRVLFSIYLLTYNSENSSLNNITDDQLSFVKRLRTIIQG